MSRYGSRPLGAAKIAACGDVGRTASVEHAASVRCVGGSSPMWRRSPSFIRASSASGADGGPAILGSVGRSRCASSPVATGGRPRRTGSPGTRHSPYGGGGPGERGSVGEVLGISIESPSDVAHATCSVLGRPDAPQFSGWCRSGKVVNMGKVLCFDLC